MQHPRRRNPSRVFYIRKHKTEGLRNRVFAFTQGRIRRLHRIAAFFEINLAAGVFELGGHFRSEEHTYELQSLMRISYAVFCLKKKKNNNSMNSKDANRHTLIHSIHP